MSLIVAGDGSIMNRANFRNIGPFTVRGSARSRHAELLLLCARIGYNP